MSAQTTSTDSASSSSSDSPTNVVVDFDATYLDSNMMPGDSGILNLVLKNTGSQYADNVYVSLPSNSLIHIDKRFYLGRMDPGESKTMPVLIRVESTAKTGLTGIQVQISYNGFDSSGQRDNNKLVTMEIPVRIYGNPLFQLTPSKTTYYKDNAEEIKLQGVALSPVKGLETTLSSGCLTVMGSSRSYVGDIYANQTFNLMYQIKPSASGACIASVRLSYTDESGSKVSDNVSIGLNVEDAGVDFKITDVSYTPTGPGEQTNMKIMLKNVGSADAESVTVYLDLSSPFAPVGTSERYLQRIKAGEDVEFDFGVAVGWDASTTSYSMPMNIDYKVGGTSYTLNKSVGIDVSGKVILAVMQVQSSGGNVRIDVANIGTRTADGVKATLIVSPAANTQQAAFNRSRQAGENASMPKGDASQAGRNMTSSPDQQQRIISYKSDIKPSKQTTFTFSTSATGPAILEIEYTGVNNERITQTERVTLSGGSSFATRGSSNTNGNSTTTTAIAAAVVLVIAYLAYRWLKGRKRK
ncbi:MAG: hypothetical protein PHG85_04375 [Candidatus Altiarchaeota archaeon]|nr:hypothetical protein [Candidatus Altiarchaeota archaeon]